MEEKNGLVKQIFTFGCGQAHENCYIVFWGKTKEECREKMFQAFGDKWSMQYDSEKQAGVDEFHLTEIH